MVINSAGATIRYGRIRLLNGATFRSEAAPLFFELLFEIKPIHLPLRRWAPFLKCLPGQQSSRCTPSYRSDLRDRIQRSRFSCWQGGLSPSCGSRCKWLRAAGKAGAAFQNDPRPEQYGRGRQACGKRLAKPVRSTGPAEGNTRLVKNRVGGRIGFLASRVCPNDLKHTLGPGKGKSPSQADSTQ